MKKFCFSLMTIFLLFLCSCSARGDIIPIDGVIFDEGIYQYKDWDNMEFAVEGDCVKDKETAIEIAISITEGFQKEGFFTGYVPQSVYFDTEDNIWIVCLYPNEEGYVGSDFCIAIKKDNAEVVKMWVGE